MSAIRCLTVMHFTFILCRKLRKQEQPDRASWSRGGTGTMSKTGRGLVARPIQPFMATLFHSRRMVVPIFAIVGVHVSRSLGSKSMFWPGTALLEGHVLFRNPTWSKTIRFSGVWSPAL